MPLETGNDKEKAAAIARDVTVAVAGAMQNPTLELRNPPLLLLKV